jgi:hypothetical protein
LTFFHLDLIAVKRPRGWTVYHFPVFIKDGIMAWAEELALFGNPTYATT